LNPSPAEVFTDLEGFGISAIDDELHLGGIATVITGYLVLLEQFCVVFAVSPGDVGCPAFGNAEEVYLLELWEDVEVNPDGDTSRLSDEANPSLFKGLVGNDLFIIGIEGGDIQFCHLVEVLGYSLRISVQVTS